MAPAAADHPTTTTSAVDPTELIGPVDDGSGVVSVEVVGQKVLVDGILLLDGMSTTLRAASLTHEMTGA